MELDGVEFPFSRGVSFYEVNAQGRIVFARDIVEPTFKPGGAALAGISLVAPLVRRLGPAASPAALKRLPLAAGAMWAFWAGYVGYVMLGTSAPGLPAWQTPPETLQAVLHESLNFFVSGCCLCTPAVAFLLLRHRPAALATGPHSLRVCPPRPPPPLLVREHWARPPGPDPRALRGRAPRV